MHVHGTPARPRRPASRARARAGRQDRDDGGRQSCPVPGLGANWAWWKSQQVELEITSM